MSVIALVCKLVLAALGKPDLQVSKECWNFLIKVVTKYDVCGGGVWFCNRHNIVRVLYVLY